MRITLSSGAMPSAAAATRARAVAAEIDACAPRDTLLRAVAPDDVEEVEHEALPVVGGHERALALAAHQRLLRHEAVDGLADGADRHAEARARARASEGIASPGFQSPVEMPSTRRARTCSCERAVGGEQAAGRGGMAEHTSNSSS